MKKLADRCKRSFSSSVRFRGLDYFVRKKIEKPELHENGFTAVVAGVQKFPVTLFWGKAAKFKTLSTSCSCVTFSEGLLCEHIWATVLEADKLGHNESVGGTGLLQVLLGEDLSLHIGAVGAHAEPEITPGDRSWLLQMKSALAETIEPKKNKIEVSVPQAKNSSQAKIFYTLNLRDTLRDKKLWVNFYYGSAKTAKKPSEIRPAYFHDRDVNKIEDAAERQTLDFLFSFQRGNYEGYNRYRAESSSISVEPINIPAALHALTSSAGFYESFEALEASLSGGASKPIPPLGLQLENKFTFEHFVIRDGERFKLQGRLRKGTEVIPLSQVKLYFDNGIFLFQNNFSRFDDSQTVVSWIEAFNKTPQKFLIPVSDAAQFLEAALNSPTPIDLPSELRWPRRMVEPKVNALFRTDGDLDKKWIFLTFEFDYGYKSILSSSPIKVIIDGEKKIIHERNFDFEKEVHQKISVVEVGDTHVFEAYKNTLKIPASKFVDFVQKCLSYGWGVKAEGKQIRIAGNFNLKVSSGIDWFELSAQAEFAGMQASLPALLTAVERGDKFIVLGDGTVGMLPEAWLQKYASLAALGDSVDGNLRFKSNQAILLDAWLGEEKNLEVDASFKNIRERISKFSGVVEQTEPLSFKGKLRPYQREGLSWFDFLEQFHLGGILADDMGLGKTIQCLAMFEKRRLQNLSEKKKDKNFKRVPSLVVAPKSLVFNWIDEAENFTPELKVLNYTGLAREKSFSDIFNYDVIVTTYQTLRLDIEKIKDIMFDCAIIDEAQAIKNDDAQVTKATKLIKAKFRLAMTGTPVENSLADLFSISEFANPGLLGKKALERISSVPGEEGASEAAMKSLSIALKPFILRRTKSQVLGDLPEKSEQVLHIVLGDQQKKEYNDLREYFKASLDKKIEKDGLKKSQFQVLTALLRLRQAALHPGLIDKTRVEESSAKLDALVAQLHEVTSEGHKALVFSQFTKFLGIIKLRLDKEKIKFQYLDGQTQNRKSVVNDFKTDSTCKVFLMSLKAGGVGLNLVEADYVFLLDPWWNPAVEAQAIDRVHRIGQKNKVFAYKFIATDTVEEKILELQKSKKLLADAIISTDKGFLKNMTAQDLQMLLT